MQIQKNVPLAQYTSLGCGGPAEFFVFCKTVEELESVLNSNSSEELHVFGFGTNSLISDHGLQGLTIVYQGGNIVHEGDVLIADAGVWWDSVVEKALAEGLWGIELMSGIPSSVGGAVMGNIAAYGQQISNTLLWVDVFDSKTKATRRIQKDEIHFEYRASSLQQKPGTIILRAAFKLSRSKTSELTYAAAVKIAEELALSTEELKARRTVVLETRKRGGSLYSLHDPTESRTAGSFFKNPLVLKEQAEYIANHDETGKSLQLLLNQSKVHGGDVRRTSAAHVLLAAGFKRGQSWGHVRLHPDHVLKIENTGGATAQEVYNVAQLIMDTVKSKLNIQLVPEVQFFGHFDGVE